MKVGDKELKTIWLNEDASAVCVIDQRLLPHELKILSLRSAKEIVDAICNMVVRGAPLIGVAAAYGVYLAALEAAKGTSFSEHLARACEQLAQCRPTAVNLARAIEKQRKCIDACRSEDATIAALRKQAEALADEEVQIAKAIGRHGLTLIKSRSAAKRGGTVQILTHCNAGWLCSVDWGTATAPIYAAQKESVPVHVYVGETRPRNQGAALTAWELGQSGVDYTLIADNTGGHLLQRGIVDMVIVGTDRVARNGDVANKIGTYLKALAAAAHQVPFYVAAPSSSIDFRTSSGIDIPIEKRSEDEVKWVYGKSESGQIMRVLICPEEARAANYAFDVTPAALVTGLITERGICAANEQALLAMFPEMREVICR